MKRRLTLVAASAALLLSTPPLEAQFGPSRRSSGPAAAALEIGARAGVDLERDAVVVGGQLRIPVARVEFAPGVQAIFPERVNDYEVDLDAVLFTAEGSALYIGGGAAVRNSKFGESDERSWKTGFNVIVGFRSVRRSGDRSFAPQVEFRYTKVDIREARSVTVGLNYPIVFF